MAGADARFTVKQKIPIAVANPLFHDGQRLVPGVTRTFNANRPLYVFLQAYERSAATMRPLAAYVTFIRDGVKAFETDTLGVNDEWDPNLKAVPIRFTIPLSSLETGPYDCQISVLDPIGNRAAFWRAPSDCAVAYCQSKTRYTGRPDVSVRLERGHGIDPDYARRCEPDRCQGRDREQQAPQDACLQAEGFCGRHQALQKSPRNDRACDARAHARDHRNHALSHDSSANLSGAAPMAMRTPISCVRCVTE